MRQNLYAIRTIGGPTYYVEASTRHEAEQRAHSSAVARELFQSLLNELSSIQSIELHRGPAHTARRGLVFEDEFFQ